MKNNGITMANINKFIVLYTLIIQSCIYRFSSKEKKSSSIPIWMNHDSSITLLLVTCMKL